MLKIILSKFLLIAVAALFIATFLTPIITSQNIPQVDLGQWNTSMEYRNKFMASNLATKTYLYFNKIVVQVFSFNQVNFAFTDNVQSTTSTDLDKAIGDDAKVLTAILALISLLLALCFIKLFIRGFIQNKLVDDGLGLFIFITSIIVLAMLANLNNKFSNNFSATPGTGSILAFVGLSLLIINELVSNNLIHNLQKNLLAGIKS